ncbi:hypothetical protein GTZ99_13430 [Novosphingobium sp. FSY-8]|uniref:Hemoglobin-like flavoprotein n=1 Tax=Novosphingobium ovatum TaxID=1908523 RepID=A0ABW9XG73_9SPHN|nr:hypothetical protein [Novosphingobium ovatum]NBC37551.1 hypothetical protein [Novosphingobium ovatum]
MLHESITAARPDAHAAMLDSLEVIALADVDIVPLYFTRFFATYPDEEGNFYNKTSSQGLMVNEMLSMLLAQAEGAEWVPMMTRTQVITHRDHSDIALERYRGALDLLVAVLAAAAGDGWTPAHHAAWQGEVDRLFTLIARAH